jgi:hypothetical protein
VNLVSAATKSQLILKSPFTLTVDEITGIADPPIGQGMKEVTFTWSSRGIPGLLRPIVCVSGTGQAILRRYDDGWRVQEVGSLRKNCAARAWTDLERTQIAQFKTAEQERLRVEAEKAQRAESQRLEQIEVSKKPTRELYRGAMANNPDKESQ